MIKPFIKAIATAADIFIVGSALQSIYNRFASTPENDNDDIDNDDDNDENEDDITTGDD